MRVVWILLTILLGALALLSVLRLAEKAFTGTLDRQAGVQVLIALVFGWLASKTLSKARSPSSH